MARGLWHYLKNMPPIDIEAIAQEHAERFYFGKKGPQPIGWNKKAWEVRRANQKARQEAAAGRALARYREHRKQFKQPYLNAKILGAMEPGHWYGRPDITVLSGAKRNSVHPRLARFERVGWVERAENPEWSPTVYRKGVGIHIAARGRVPQYLFRLTPRGERERRCVAYLA